MSSEFYSNTHDLLGPVNVTELPEDMQFNDSTVIFIACYTVIMVVGVVGNMCVLRAILAGSRRHRKSRVNFMLLHLAIADLIVTLLWQLLLPIAIGWSSSRQISFVGSIASNICSMLLRFFAVVYPLSLRAASRRGQLMLAVAWLLACSCSVPQMLIFHVDRHEVHRHYRQCVTFGSFPSLRHEMVYNLFCLTMLYVAPITIIVMSYGAIVITIVRKTKLTADEYYSNTHDLLGPVNVTELPEDMQFNDSTVIFIACYTVIMVVGVVGNMCVLRAILAGSRRHRKSRVNFMLLHLAIADLI
ncbi:adipokinetic hormone/corazonin-related peptide receptor variant I-like, partial [Hyalella azteca]|uniref:Adipokinetic hormone/corazonin-related peptide receptor variant I-like n=1 Tax=Hyalella azteca TaxID=294128 RepID=A0A979FVU0_HYAAZ